MKPKLTPKEALAVVNFIRAAKALPESIAVSINDPTDGYGTLFVHKRISQCEAECVAKLNKESLFF